MFTPASSTVAPGALLLANSRLAATSRPAAATASALLCQNRTQPIRNISFGWWTVHHSRDQQREMRHRYKVLRHKYVDAQIRTPPWEQTSGASSEGPRAYRRSVNHYWQSKRCFAFTRHRSAKESSPGKQEEAWTSALGDIRRLIDLSQASFLLSKTGRGTSEPLAGSSSSTSAEDADYFIDPITNRKVSRASAKSSLTEIVGGPSSKPSSAPIFDADLPPSQAELKAYGNIVVEDDFESLADTKKEPKYDDLYKYRPVSWNEPDGKPDIPVELGHEGYDAREVQKYQPYQWNEPDGQPTTPPAEIGHLGYDPAEVAKYKPFMWNEPDGQPTTPPVEVGQDGYDPEEVAKYKPFMWNEPDGQPATPVELGHHGYNQAEVQKYKPFKHNEPDGKPAAQVAEPVELGHHGYDQAEVQQYKAFRHNEPDGKPTTVADSTAASLSEYDAKVAAGTLGKVYSKTGSSSTKPTTRALESSMAQISAEHDAIDKLASLSIRSSKSRAEKQLTQAERVQALADPYSTEPQGLETAYAQECGSESAGLPYVKFRRSTSRRGIFDGTDPAAPQTVAEPHVYKIIAFDPTLKSIKIVETTSTVSDTATPLTPTEVLLRLSNPTKFLPHFESLQSQGFEIVSGSGDVMVFRKVRDPSAGAAASSSSSIRTEAGASAVNPIDMTGKKYVPPSTANFVSPTGYVNLDPPPPFEESLSTSAADLPAAAPASTPARAKAAAERFQSNIGVRREEPVFSGPKRTARDSAAAKQPGVAKRMLVGATWVAGVSYGIGVASEYLKGL